MTAHARLLTSRFQNKALNNKEFDPLRIARMAPRWKLPYKIVAKIDLIMPSKDTLAMAKDGCAEEEFREAYYSDLSDEAADAAHHAGKVAAAAGRSAVLLCFCDLGEVDFCHRRMFADWFRKRTGEEIPEMQTA